MLSKINAFYLRIKELKKINKVAWFYNLYYDPF